LLLELLVRITITTIRDHLACNFTPMFESVAASEVSSEASTRGTKEQIEEELEAKRHSKFAQGARHAVDVELAEIAAQDAKEAKDAKAAAQKVFEQALGVNAKALLRRSCCSGLLHAIPMMMFLFIIVGCEIDLYGFVLSFRSYWQMDILPLRVLLVVGPTGYVVGVAMFMFYSGGSEEDEVPEAPKTKGRKKSINPLKPTTLGASVEADVESGGHEPLEEKIIDSREKVSLRYYHFVPAFRNYLIIKDQNPSDVEGLFRVNSLSSFTMGIAQMCGIGFMLATGTDMDLFVKVNIASQIINWSITVLYFSTSIAKRMKASFKVNTLLDNSVNDLRKEYESYLNIVNEAQQMGAGPVYEKNIKAFHDSMNYEVSEFVRQKVDLSVFTMEEKYQWRLAIRRRMYATYTNIN